MTPEAAKAWVDVECAKRDTVVVPAKQHTYRTAMVILALVGLPLEKLIGIPDGLILASIVTFGGVWGTIEIIRAAREKHSHSPQ